MKAITILGSTGSIGTQTLDIVTHNPDKFRVVGLAAGSNVTLLAEQIRTFKPEIVALGNEAKLVELKEAIADCPHQPQILVVRQVFAKLPVTVMQRALSQELSAVQAYYLPFQLLKLAKTLPWRIKRL